jgi:mRNA interferase HicA
MKRVDLIRALEGLGCEFVRHGGKHDWYRNPATGISQPIPRHREIKERLSRRIIKMLGNPLAPLAGRQEAD